MISSALAGIITIYNFLPQKAKDKLSDIAYDLIGTISKQGYDKIRTVIGKDEIGAILAKAYKDFSEKYSAASGDESSAYEIFNNFLKDKRTIQEFKKIFSSQYDEIDFDELEEIFIEKCLDMRVAIIPDFDFLKNLEDILDGIEVLAKSSNIFTENVNRSNISAIVELLKKRGTEANPSIAKKKYLQQLIYANNRLKFTGIPDPKDKKDIEITSIFIMQRVVEKIPETDYLDMNKTIDEDNELNGSDIYTREKERRITNNEENTPTTFADILNKNKDGKFVILGTPGSGKSTLLKYLLLSFAQNHFIENLKWQKPLLPIIIEISKFEYKLGRGANDYGLIDYLYDAAKQYSNIGLPSGFFEKYLNQGNAVLLFDGLDEIASENKRSEIKDIISNFVNLYKKNLVIITSRIAGYNKTRFSTSDFKHLTLCDFNDSEIKEFVIKWYRTKQENDREVEERVSDLIYTFETRPSIIALARNPLLLTIIAIIHRYENHLPEERLSLYDKATEALLNTWVNAKQISIDKSYDNEFSLQRKRIFLEKVAFNLQSLEKGDESGTMLNKSDLSNILLPEFCNIFSCNEVKAREIVDNFIEHIRLRSGILVELAPDQYGFIHKTFQEYFSAKYIANEVLGKFDPCIMYEYIDRFITNPFWQETLLLAIRCLPNQQAKLIIDYIIKLDNKSEIANYLHHNQYFAFKFLAEQGCWLNNKAFVQSVFSDYYCWLINNMSLSKYIVSKRFDDSMSLLVNNYSQNLMLEIITPDICSQNMHRKLCAAKTANYLDKVIYRIFDGLLNIITDPKHNSFLRERFAEAIGHSIKGNEKIIDSFIVIVKNNEENPNIRIRCIEALLQLGYKDEWLIGILLEIMYCKSLHIKSRIKCTDLIFQSGIKSQFVFTSLLNIIEHNEYNLDFRVKCAKVLLQLDIKESRVDIVIIEIIRNKNQDFDFREKCAKVLLQLGIKEQEVVLIFLDIVKDKNQELDFRRRCITTILRSNIKERWYIDILYELIKDPQEDIKIRIKCIKALVRLGIKEQFFTSLLLEIIMDMNQNLNIRINCIDSIILSGIKDQWVLDSLSELAKNPKQDSNIHIKCMKALSIDQIHKPWITDSLSSMIKEANQDISIMVKCMELLIQFKIKDSWIFDYLKKILNNKTHDPYLRARCVAAIEQFGIEKKEIAKLLIEASINESSLIVLQEIALSLDKMGNRNDAIDILSKVYLPIHNKASNRAREIYDSIWELTSVE